jgi:uncharacterized protein (TIGR03435 family)
MKALCVFATAGCLFARTANTPLMFDVASIKPSALGTQGDFITDFLSGGGYQAFGATLKNLIMQAYDINDYQVSGGPTWLDSARFDILARPDRPGTGQQIPERLRKLLVDRFQLVIQRDIKQLPVYALVIAKSGPKLQESEDGKSRMSGKRGSLSGKGVEIPRLASRLSDRVGRPVIDKTGLTGRYNFELQWTPEGAQSDNGPSLFTALPEQLGLRLESEKGPVEMFVIDRVERPSEN